MVVHANNATSVASLARAQGAVDSGVAFWKTPARHVLIMRRADADKPAIGYEYRSARSVDPGQAGEKLDRTGIPVREFGGQQTMQLRPLRNRRTGGQHVSRKVTLWRPELAKKRP
jgi:hypothetical protein